MARSDVEMDAILDLSCFCDQMNVMKTQWFGPNAGRRFRACWNNTCDYHVWIDEEPMGARTIEIIKELQERALDWEANLKLKLTRYIEWHEMEMAKVKKKQHTIVMGMFCLVSLMMNMAVHTMNDDTVGSIEDYDELDL